MRLRPTSPIFSPLRGKKMKNCTSHIGKFEKIQIKIFAYYIYLKTILNIIEITKKKYQITKTNLGRMIRKEKTYEDIR